MSDALGFDGAVSSSHAQRGAVEAEGSASRRLGAHALVVGRSGGSVGHSASHALTACWMRRTAESKRDTSLTVEPFKAPWQVLSSATDSVSLRRSACACAADGGETVAAAAAFAVDAAATVAATTVAACSLLAACAFLRRRLLFRVARSAADVAVDAGAATHSTPPPTAPSTAPPVTPSVVPSDDLSVPLSATLSVTLSATFSAAPSHAHTFALGKSVEPWMCASAPELF
eukprot:4163164-Pleurochrysis_carterae.AAC.1